MADTEIDYQLVLADMEKKRDALDAAIANMRAWLGATATGQRSSGQPQDIPSDAFFGLGITDAIKKYLRLAKGKKSTNDIVQALEKGGITHASKNFRNTVSTTLYREADKPSNEIVKIGEGEWGLAEWYPGLRTRRTKSKEADEMKTELGTEPEGGTQLESDDEPADKIPDFE